MQYIDLQINGAFNTDFNAPDLTIDAFRACIERLAKVGVNSILPTIITDDLSTMCSRIDRIVSFLDAEPELEKFVAGIHVEGPFISPAPGFRGTHPVEFIRPASEDDCNRILEAGNGRVRLMTLAPEMDEQSRVIQLLDRAHVLVFAGHTDASFDTLKRAIDSGLRGFTHLGNGCVKTVDRHDNIVHRVLALRDHLAITLIADGIHVPDWLLKSWIEIIGTKRAIVVSDAISAAGMPPGEYSIGGQKAIVHADGRTSSSTHGYLVGSATLQPRMESLLRDRFAFDTATLEDLFYNNAKSLLES